MLCLLVFGCAHAQPSTVAIRGITVVDVKDGSLHPGQTVLVAGNRIGAVGSVREVAVPDHAMVVEAAGRYLIPGLWDMHVHSVANVAVDRSLRSVAAQDWHFPLFLAHGVTGVRNMNDGTGDVTLALTKTVRRQLAEGVLRGPPRFLTSGPPAGIPRQRRRIQSSGGPRYVRLCAIALSIAVMAFTFCA